MSSIDISPKVVSSPTGANSAPANAGGRAAAKPKTDLPVPTQPMVSIKDVVHEAAQSKSAATDQIVKTAEEVKASIEALNQVMRDAPTSLQFSIDNNSKRFVVQVTDTDTGEIIKSVPGEAILRIAENLESLKGVLFDDLY